MTRRPFRGRGRRGSPRPPFAVAGFVTRRPGLILREWQGAWDFSPPYRRPPSFQWESFFHTIRRAPGLRCACLPCSTYCSSTPARAKRLASFRSIAEVQSPADVKTSGASGVDTDPDVSRLNDAPPGGAGAALACISHHPTVEAHDTTAMTSLFLRNACLPCSTYCSSTPARAKRLAPRRVLTALSPTSPRRVVRMQVKADNAGTAVAANQRRNATARRAHAAPQTVCQALDLTR